MKSAANENKRISVETVFFACACSGSCQGVCNKCSRLAKSWTFITWESYKLLELWEGLRMLKPGMVF